MATEREKLLSAVERMAKARKAAIAAGIATQEAKSAPILPVEKAASSPKA